MRRTLPLVIAAGALLGVLAMWWAMPSLDVDRPTPTPTAQPTPARAPTPPTVGDGDQAVATPFPMPSPAAEPVDVVPEFTPPPPGPGVDITLEHSASSLVGMATGLKDHQDRVRTCYENWAEVYGHIHGKLEFEVKVAAGPEGTLVQPRADAVWAVANVESLEDCVNRALEDLQYAAPETSQSLVWQVP